MTAPSAPPAFRIPPVPACDPPGAVVVYAHMFADGDRYYGATAQRPPEYRWLSQWSEQSPVGRKMRTGIPFVSEVLCVAPDRATAERIERLAVLSGNPHGQIINTRVRYVADCGGYSGDYDLEPSG